MRLGLSLVVTALPLASFVFGAAPANAQNVSKKIFLNNCIPDGCTIMPGQNNSRTNHSTIVDQTSFISPFSHPEVWDQVVDCVKEMYAPYDVEVTDIDPGDTEPHHEAIVAGQAAEIGAGDGVGGLGLGGCNLVDNAMSFTFDVWGPNPLTICAVIAQESAHTYGLDHEMDCSDPLTYLPACGRQFFRDKNIVCGEFQERNCSCGASVQNSHKWLLSQLGANATPVPGPDTVLNSPQDGAQVNPGFVASVDASHVRGIGRVEFWVNGTMMHMVPGSANQNTYSWLTPSDKTMLADGIMDLEMKAYNDIGSETVVAVTVTKGAPCENAETDCNAGQFCDAGRCITPTPTGELGDSCTKASDCISGLCPLEGDSGYCSQDCNPVSALMECPEGMFCREVGASGVCWPEDGGGCGCNSGDRKGGLGTLLLALGVVILVGRRRRRSIAG